MSASVRVGVVGLGEAGETLHLPAIAAHPEAQLVGVCDGDSSRREAAAARWGVTAYPDVETMLSSVHPDLVVVATPPESHASICLQVLAAGSHVLCEKPFVMTVDEADRVLAATSHRSVTVNHEFREMPIFRAMVDAARHPGAGDLVFAQAWQQYDLPPWKESGWRGALDRRTLFEAGVHLLDLLVGLFGASPVSVHCVTSAAGQDARNRDALVVATLEFPGGRLGVLTQNRMARGEPQYFEARADTTRASFRASFGGRARLSAGLHRKRPHVRLEYGASGIAWKEIGATRHLLARNPSNPNVAATRVVLDRALRATRAGVAGGDAAHARLLTAVIAACYESASSGRRVELEPSSATIQDGRRL